MIRTKRTSYDGRYYTEAEIDALLAALSSNHSDLDDMPSSSNTDHDGRYYTEAEINNLLAIGSNVGSAGTGVYKQKTSNTLELYKLNPTNNMLTIALDGTDKIDFTVNIGNIDHGGLNAASLLDDDHTQYLLVDGSRALTGTLKLNANGTLDIGENGTGVKKMWLGNDTTTPYALPGFRGLACEYANGDIYIGNDNYFPGYYVQKTVQHGSVVSDASTDYTNLYQGDSAYPNLTMMYEIESTGSNAIYIGDGATAPVPLIFRNTSLGFMFKYDQPNNKFLMDSQGLQTAFLELQLDHKSIREAFRPATTNKIDIGDNTNNLKWRDGWFAGAVDAAGGFATGGAGGHTGWFDDGANFRVTVTGGIITAIANSTAGGWA